MRSAEILVFAAQSLSPRKSQPIVIPDVACTLGVFVNRLLLVARTVT